ncbi:MAG TPA: Gfo/Idh/MocA family oxidoreductase, partial [Burkholderiales bacterium]|nr:Gfo/Idh/MocA family oxidoreductase [Burkholderiales bacterium]
VIETIIGRIARVASMEWTATPERIDEQGARYPVAVDDSAATLVELESGAFGTILSSWATRVRRDDLLTLQVDGTEGSAVAGLHRCHVQSAAQTPTIAHFSVMKDIGADYRDGWRQAPPLPHYRNPYRVGWEQFLRHVATGAPIACDFAAGIRDVAFAEACHRSMRERRWVEFPPADTSSGQAAPSSPPPLAGRGIAYE